MAGNETRDIAYSFIDEDYPDIEVVYYRLKESDIAGTTMLSNTIAVSPAKHEAGVSVLREIYPNPAYDKLTIPFLTTQDDIVNAEIYDIHGLRVMTVARDQQYNEGTNEIIVYLHGLNNGMYFLRFTTETKPLSVNLSFKEEVN